MFWKRPSPPGALPKHDHERGAAPIDISFLGASAPSQGPGAQGHTRLPPSLLCSYAPSCTCSQGSCFPAFLGSELRARELGPTPGCRPPSAAAAPPAAPAARVPASLAFLRGPQEGKGLTGASVAPGVHPGASQQQEDLRQSVRNNRQEAAMQKASLSSSILGAVGQAGQAGVASPGRDLLFDPALTPTYKSAALSGTPVGPPGAAAGTATGTSAAGNGAGPDAGVSSGRGRVSAQHAQVKAESKGDHVQEHGVPFLGGCPAGEPGQAGTHLVPGQGHPRTQCHPGHTDSRRRAARRLSWTRSRGRPFCPVLWGSLLAERGTLPGRALGRPGLEGVARLESKISQKLPTSKSKPPRAAPYPATAVKARPSRGSSGPQSAQKVLSWSASEGGGRGESP